MKRMSEILAGKNTTELVVENRTRKKFRPYGIPSVLPRSANI